MGQWQPAVPPSEREKVLIGWERLRVPPLPPPRTWPLLDQHEVLLPSRHGHDSPDADSHSVAVGTHWLLRSVGHRTFIPTAAVAATP